MGSEASSCLSADAQAKIFRQLEREFLELKQTHSSNALIEALEASPLYERYLELVNSYTGNLRIASSWNCPKRRFGRTELQMPILSCGGMRQQESWSPKEGTTLEQINKECQKNFEAIVKKSMQLGINHFETARGYGTSELQYGPILKAYPRNSYILQTKVAPKDSQEEFRMLLEKSFSSLQLGEGDYVDLFSFHGLNKPEHLEMITKEKGCMEVIKEYVRAGKIKFVGFSTHAMTPVIIEAIETDLFDYVNLHYHFVGSYTATGTGPKGSNIAAIEAAKRHDMGVFIISPSDKGGALYEPPIQLCRDVAPLTPIAFNNLFLWSNPSIHTLVIGCARPEDFDEHVEAAMRLGTDGGEKLALSIANKLYKKVKDTFSDDSFLDTWFVGLPDAYSNSEGLPIAYLYWLYWIIKAWGMYNFALVRYKSLESSNKNWKYDRPIEENLKEFSWVPGIAFVPERESQLRSILSSHPRCEHVVEAIKELHTLLHNGGCIARGEKPPPGYDSAGWATAYDLQPQKPLCER